MDPDKPNTAKIIRLPSRLTDLGADRQYLDDAYPELQKLYPGEWVAVWDQEVVAHGKDEAEVYTAAYAIVYEMVYGRDEAASHPVLTGKIELLTEYIFEPDEPMES